MLELQGAKIICAITHHTDRWMEGRTTYGGK